MQIVDHLDGEMLWLCDVTSMNAVMRHADWGCMVSSTEHVIIILPNAVTRTRNCQASFVALGKSLNYAAGVLYR
jgi:hypothetical protein